MGFPGGGGTGRSSGGGNVCGSDAGRRDGGVSEACGVGASEASDVLSAGLA